MSIDLRAKPFHLSDEQVKWVSDTLASLSEEEKIGQLFCPISFALSNGLRASGDARYSMYATIASSVVIRMALSLLLGQTLRMGVVGVALAMVCDWLSKAVFIWIRYRSGKWKSFKVI